MHENGDSVYGILMLNVYIKLVHHNYIHSRDITKIKLPPAKFVMKMVGFTLAILAISIIMVSYTLLIAKRIFLNIMDIRFERIIIIFNI